MNDLLQLYVRRVTTLLAQLDADLERRKLAPDREWSRTKAALQQGLEQMPGLRADQLDAALVQQRSQLAHLGDLYLQVSRNAEP
jgi:hypothetical protein